MSREVEDLNVTCAKLSQLAHSCAKANNHAGALSLWKLIRSRFPDYAPAWSEAVYACLAVGDKKQAEHLASEAMAVAPQFLDGFAGHAEIAASQQDWGEAKARWLVAQSRFPSHALCYEKAIGCCLRVGARYEALRLARLGLARASDKRKLLCLYMKLLLDQNRPESVLALLKERSSLWSCSAYGCALAAEAYLAVQNWDGARICIAVGEKLEAGNHFLAIVGTHLEFVRCEDASVLLTVGKTLPPDAELHVFFAEMLLRCRQWLMTENFCKTAISSFHDCQALYDLYSQSAFAAGDFYEAARRWLGMRNTFPTCVTGYCGQIKALLAVYDGDQADQVYATASVAFPNSPELQECYAEMASAANRYNEALRRWEIFRKLEPASPTGYYRASLIHLENNQCRSALAYCQQGLKVDSHNVVLHDLLARIFWQMGEYTSATQTLVNALKLFPCDAVLANTASDYFVSSQDFNFARKFIESCSANYNEKIVKMMRQLRIDYEKRPWGRTDVLKNFINNINIHDIDGLSLADVIQLMNIIAKIGSESLSSFYEKLSSHPCKPFKQRMDMGDFYHGLR